MQMNMPDIYDAALYLRLSKDDMEEGGAKSESNSIANHLQENSCHYRFHGRGRQRPNEGNGTGELPAHQGGGEADCAG